VTPPPWGIPVVLVVGVLVVLAGWWWDRRRHRLRDAALHEPPERAIPGLPPGREVAYVTEDEVLATPPATPDFDAAAEDALLRYQDSATLPGGTPDGRFLTHPRRGVAVLVTPDVLVSEAPVGSGRELLTLLDAARRRGRPVVIVAPEFDADAVATLRANAVTGRLRILPVEVADARALRRAVALTGGRLVAAGDLAADYLPPRVWGTCAAWVADLDDSWVVLDEGERLP